MKDLSNLPYRKGVGIMLLNQETKVFIGKRIDSTKAWQMPQGGVDQKEDVLNAAKRELKEETGITSIEIIKKSEKMNDEIDDPNQPMREVGKFAKLSDYKSKKPAPSTFPFSMAFTNASVFTILPLERFNKKIGFSILEKKASFAKNKVS